MNGLDRIIEKIETDAESVSASAIADAEKKAGDIIAEAEAKGESDAREIVADAESTGEAMVKKAHSGGEHRKKKIILERKVEIIDNVISKAVKNFLCDEPNKYFDAMIRLAQKYALTEEQTLIFSDKDFERMPADFEQRVNDAAGKGKISVRGGGGFEGGFLLVGKEVTQNCTVNALVSEAETEIRDELYKLLFTE